MSPKGVRADSGTMLLNVFTVDVSKLYTLSIAWRGENERSE